MDVRSKICVCSLGRCVMAEVGNLTDNDCMECPFNRVMTDREAEEFIEWACKKYGVIKNDDNRKN